MIRKIMVAALGLSMAAALSAQDFGGYTQKSADVNYDKPAPTLDEYFTPSGIEAVAPGAKGFVTRWTLLEPIAKPEIRTNAIFNDSYLRTEFTKEYFKDQLTIVPKDGQKTKVGKAKLKWHSLDSRNYNVKLYRFATGYGLHPTEGLFWAVTVINCPEDMTVRMSVGSNSASMWWLDGEEVILLSGDRRMVVDDCVSREITLKQGRNVIRGAVINGPGMSDFCVRFLDAEGKPVTNFTVTNK